MPRQSHPIQFIHNPDPASLPPEVELFLRRLGGPTLIVVDGRDNSRCRAVATLLHGNEPSGVKALLKWLRTGERPAVRLICLIASVQTALHETLFCHRQMPGQRDLNRCFAPPFEDNPGHIARHFIELLAQYQPEALLDIHNTSGMSPAFGVVVSENPEHEALVALFTQRMIVTELRLGALMELSCQQMPVVTIECGGAGQAGSDRVAEEGLQRYLFNEQVLHPPSGLVMDLYKDAVRLQLLPSCRIAFAEQPVAGADLTVPPDVERFNFGTIPALTRLGWLGSEGMSVFRVQSATGENLLPHYFLSRASGLYSAQQLKLFMITTNPAIALSDCLFYACADIELEQMVDPRADNEH
ncbi:Succinylglutamate desuccinylase / Aspartoacylase family protein [Amphritea atlantica]|uniref:Succinylglutamate desuccinylase / Aspartoacylase family protein n=1 Tax=Amphritea atlantica TaxID=355243 RepID=A0A1H9JP16_9GAMM|nr:succinylglutamate desuccinylase/aspartoacylase family protein [Amphritea atlantica]SEQ88557.1 Succinylglutamate desuccinylase / Aspartoacylase family protein [Amphritea atlantica]